MASLLAGLAGGAEALGTIAMEDIRAEREQLKAQAVLELQEQYNISGEGRRAKTAAEQAAKQHDYRLEELDRAAKHARELAAAKGSGSAGGLKLTKTKVPMYDPQGNQIGEQEVVVYFENGQPHVFNPIDTPEQRQADEKRLGLFAGLVDKLLNGSSAEPEKPALPSDPAMPGGWVPAAETAPEASTPAMAPAGRGLLGALGADSPDVRLQRFLATKPTGEEAAKWIAEQGPDFQQKLSPQSLKDLSTLPAKASGGW